MSAAASALPDAVTLYASFDESPAADFGGGELSLSTRSGKLSEPARFVFQQRFDPSIYRIAPGKGIHGGALECLDVLPESGRIYYPARGNLAYRPGGWDGALSLWINTDPDTMLKTPFCDPFQITEKGANNGAIWIDFPDVRPRDLRLGTYPATPKGGKPIPESDPAAPTFRVEKIGFRSGEWHHLAVTWTNLDTGRPDGRSVLYIDGKRMGEVAGDLRMNWNLDRTGIFLAVNYIGLLDEFALFGRALSDSEVVQLREHPGMLAAYKKKR